MEKEEKSHFSKQIRISEEQSEFIKSLKIGKRRTDAGKLEEIINIFMKDHDKN